MRCKHKNILITEIGRCFTDHVFENGEWSHYSEFDDYTGVIHIYCRDCGLNKKYTNKNTPKWVSKKFKEMLEFKIKTDFRPDPILKVAKHIG